MSKALYRTYRSKSFDEIVGQSHVTDLLKTAIASDKIAHAYLLTGPRGVGKTSVARIIAHEVNGLAYSEDTHLDIIEIDAASNRRIDDIRDLREKVHIAPASARYKVYIIDEVHMLTGESFNALLKTLEEPPAHVIFILATTEVHKLPATIISRTQRFHFRPAREADIVTHLETIAKKEHIAVEPAALALLASHADGSFRDSVSLLDQLGGLSEKITTDLVETVLGMAKGTQIDGLVQALDAHDIAALVDRLETVQADGISPIVLVEQLSRALAQHAKLQPSYYQLLDELTDVPRAYDPSLKLIATLVRFAKPVQHRTAASSTPRHPTLAATPSELQRRVKSRDSPDESERTSQQEISRAGSGLPKPVDFDWQTVLTTVKKHYPPLYSVVTRAVADYSAADDRLKLTFSYVIHRKKLETAAARKQLGAVIHDLFGVEPELIITDTKSSPSLDGDARAVAAIMGGGEPVSGTI